MHDNAPIEMHWESNISNLIILNINFKTADIGTVT